LKQVETDANRFSDKLAQLERDERIVQQEADKAAGLSIGLLWSDPNTELENREAAHRC
jgi:hypothetical protein